MRAADLLAPCAEPEPLPIAPLTLTFPQAAKVTNFSEPTLRNAVKDGKLRAIRYGRRVVFDPADLQSWLNSLKIPPNKKAVSRGQIATAAQERGIK